MFPYWNVCINSRVHAGSCGKTGVVESLNMCVTTIVAAPAQRSFSISLVVTFKKWAKRPSDVGRCSPRSCRNMKKSVRSCSYADTGTSLHSCLGCKPFISRVMSSRAPNQAHNPFSFLLLHNFLSSCDKTPNTSINTWRNKWRVGWTTI